MAELSPNECFDVPIGAFMEDPFGSSPPTTSPTDGPIPPNVSCAFLVYRQPSCPSAQESDMLPGDELLRDCVNSNNILRTGPLALIAPVAKSLRVVCS
jgi:hypothetical protein